MSKLSRKWRQRQREQSSPLNGEVTAYLDRLHRNDSGRSRNWNQAPAPGTRRQPRRQAPAEDENLVRVEPENSE